MPSVGRSEGVKGMTQTVLVTGGTGGLGRAVVPALVAAGYKVAVTYHVPSEWESMRQQVDPATVQGFEANLLDEAVVANVVSQLEGPVYGLVALAGGFEMASVVETSLDRWRHLFDLNLTTLLVACRAVLPGMQQAGQGRVVAVSSSAAPQAPANMVAYNVAKQGVIAFIETLAHELKGTALTANAIMPATLATPANLAETPDAHLLPLERVAGVITFLLGPGAAGVTAAAIPITVTTR